MSIQVETPGSLLSPCTHTKEGPRDDIAVKQPSMSQEESPDQKASPVLGLDLGLPAPRTVRNAG